MLKKILFLSATVALAFTATTASAGTTPTVPVYDVAPISGSFTVIGSEEAQNGSTKIFKDSAKAKTLIRLALGSDAGTAVPNEKNYVLGLALPDSECSAEVVVWNKVAGLIAAEVATISFCSDNSVYSEPAQGANGSYKEYGVVKVKFIGEGDGCGSLDTSLLSGRASALAYYVEKISGNSSNQQAQPVYTPVSLEINRLLGNVYADDENNQTLQAKASEQGLIITDGSFKANLASNKKLGTSTQPIKASGCGQEVVIVN